MGDSSGSIRTRPKQMISTDNNPSVASLRSAFHSSPWLKLMSSRRNFTDWR